MRILAVATALTAALLAGASVAVAGDVGANDDSAKFSEDGGAALYEHMAALGLTARDVYLVHDELTGQTWRWGQHAFVRLTYDDPAHILTLIRYGSPSAAPGPATTQG